MKKLIVFVAFLTLFSIFFCCNKDEAEDFDTCMRGCPYITQPDEKNTPELEKRDSITDENGLICTESTYSYAPGNPTPILLDPTTEIIVPGYILDGSSITSGLYTPLTGDRAPLTISHSLNHKSTIIQNPSLSTIRAGVGELNNHGEIGSTAIDYVETYVSSSEQLSINAGGHFNGFGAKVKARFDWNDKNIKSRFMIKFTQFYYSIDVDKPSSPSDWYINTPDCQLWDVSPVYISSVKYGRIGILCIESESSKLEVEAALEASYKGFGADAGFHFESEYNNVWTKSKISAFLVGGKVGDKDFIGTKTGFLNWINSDINYSREAPGVPVAYTLRYLKDNSDLVVILAGSYTVRDCDENPFFEINDSDYEDCCPIWNNEGDRDFNGYGPNQIAKAELRIHNGNVMLNVTYDVIQCDNNGNPYGDNTAASFFCDSIVYTPPNGYEVVEIITPTKTEYDEIDESNYLRIVNDYLEGESLVKSFEINGDTGDKDVGVCSAAKEKRSYLAVKFYPVEIRMKKK